MRHLMNQTKRIAIAAALAIALSATASQPPPLAPATIAPADIPKTLYAFGVLVHQRTPLGQMELSPKDLDAVIAGYRDAVLKKKPKFENESDFAATKFRQFLTERQEAWTKATTKRNDAYLEQVAAETGAEKLPSGAIFFPGKAGSGPSPTPADIVTFSYKGTLSSGQQFDSNAAGTPTELPMNQLIPCMSEAIVRLNTGGSGKIVCSPALAFGPRGSQKVPANSVVAFDINLIKFVAPDAGKVPTP